MKPGGRAQVASSRSSSSAPVSSGPSRATRSAAAAWPALAGRHFSRLQISDDRVQIVRREADGRHVVARLLRLRIGDPAVEVAAVHRQRAGGDASPAGEMGEVGRDLAARRACRRYCGSALHSRVVT